MIHPGRQQRYSQPEYAFTLIEMMVVIAIIGMLVGATTLTFRNVMRSDLRSAASRLASLLQHGFDRATTMGRVVRVAIDIEKSEAWIESSTSRFKLRKGTTQNSIAESDTGATKAKDDKAKPLPAPLATMLGAEDMAASLDPDAIAQQAEQDLQPVQRPKAQFERLATGFSKTLKLAKGISIDAVTTDRHDTPQRKGTAYVYFFPQGYGEDVLIHLVDRDKEYYSITTKPLTGQTEVQSCRVDLPAAYMAKDDLPRHTIAEQRCLERRQ